MTTTRRHWRVRTTVPGSQPRERMYAGFTTERIRVPRRGLDGGLYLVRTPDGVSRVTVLRGCGGRRGMQPHIVTALRNGIELATELAVFWPSKKDLIGITSARHGVGDFSAAVQFACAAAHTAMLRSTVIPSPQDHHQEAP